MYFENEPGDGQVAEVAGNVERRVLGVVVGLGDGAVLDEQLHDAHVAVAAGAIQERVIAAGGRVDHAAQVVERYALEAAADVLVVVVEDGLVQLLLEVLTHAHLARLELVEYELGAVVVRVLQRQLPRRARVDVHQVQVGIRHADQQLDHAHVAVEARSHQRRLPTPTHTHAHAQTARERDKHTINHATCHDDNVIL